MRSFLIFLGCLLFTASANAQEFSYYSQFSFEPTRITEPPRLGAVRPELPETAEKNGVEGVVKVTFTLGADGKVHNAVIVQDLPYGAGEAVKQAVERMTFEPAELNGTPVDLKASYTYAISAIFYEDDKNVRKVKLIGKPTAEYPASQRAEQRKGSVSVYVTFYADGKIAVGNTDSTMPREFDEAAKKAAATLKFEPAVHKKTKKPVNQVMWVVFDFKP
jgi:TonB family protein